MLFKVKIWGNELNCEVCGERKWYKNTLKTEFQREDNALEFSEEVRTMFECVKCGNCKIFGIVSAADDIDKLNLTITTILEK